MPPWLQVITTLGAAVIGGVIAPQLTQLREHRIARATVIEKARDVEAHRWRYHGYQEFRRAISAFEAAAIIARIPRRLIARYIQAAEDAYKNSEEVEFDEGPAWATPAEYSKPVDDALDAISRHVWNPWLARLPFQPRRQDR